MEECRRCWDWVLERAEVRIGLGETLTHCFLDGYEEEVLVSSCFARLGEVAQGWAIRHFLGWDFLLEMVERGKVWIAECVLVVGLAVSRW